LTNSAFNLRGAGLAQNVSVDGDEAREAAAIDCTLHRKRQSGCVPRQAFRGRHGV